MPPLGSERSSNAKGTTSPTPAPSSWYEELAAEASQELPGHMQLSDHPASPQQTVHLAMRASDTAANCPSLPPHAADHPDDHQSKANSEHPPPCSHVRRCEPFCKPFFALPCTLAYLAAPSTFTWGRGKMSRLRLSAKGSWKTGLDQRLLVAVFVISIGGLPLQAATKSRRN